VSFRLDLTFVSRRLEREQAIHSVSYHITIDEALMFPVKLNLGKALVGIDHGSPSRRINLFEIIFNEATTYTK
jgi:hypothetical protein